MLFFGNIISYLNEKEILEIAISTCSKNNFLYEDLVIDPREGYVRVNHEYKNDITNCLKVTNKTFSQNLSRDSIQFKLDLEVFIEAKQVVDYLNLRFDFLPLWARAIQPLAYDMLPVEDRNYYLMTKYSNDIVKYERGGIDIGIKYIKSETPYRSNGILSSIDIPDLPESVMEDMVGKTLHEVTGQDFEKSNNVKIKKASFNSALAITRLEMEADFISADTPPEGEEVWWIDKWSKFKRISLASKRRAK